MGREVADAVNALQESARQQLRSAIVAEQRASWVAAVVPIGLWIWVHRHPMVLGFAVVIVIGTVLRARALPAIDRGDLERAVLLFTIGKWGVSIALVLVIPIALPIVVVNLIMPIALASTNLSSHRFVPFIVASVATAFVAASLGYTTNILRLDDDVTPWVWQWLCVIVLTIHFIPLSLILWRSNQQQAFTYNEAIESNDRLREADAELRRSRRRLVGAADAERSRLERDLHDGAQQRLVSVLVQLRLANRLAVAGGDEDPERRAQAAAADELANELEAAIDELRTLAHGIYPPLLKAGGLPRALAAVARRTPAEITIDAVDVDRCDADIEAAVYFCCLEAIQNAVKHGGDDVTITIRLERTVDSVGAPLLRGALTDTGPGFDTASITDTGPGFDTASITDTAHPRGSGLQNMSDRISAAGGELAIDSRPGGGTVISFDVPIELVDPAEPVEVPDAAASSVAEPVERALT